ncbi:PaaI family thioesterase [Maribacter sp. 2307UL18-2]|uniref:PaaI family thioesterase n=1 Tax=Maribacter sp. 2307UL18-2 TaxID=3386274 RepID=UPI0039BC90E4
MSIYQRIGQIGSKFIGRPTLFKYGFNLSPMYRRSTGRIIDVSEDLLQVRIKLPLSYKNRNYVNSIFGGSMFASVDPIPMVQLIQLLGSNYVVWDKSAEIFFKRPAKEHLFAEFKYTENEVAAIKQKVEDHNETEILKTTQLMNKDGSVVFCEVKKRIYIADKIYFKNKRKTKK